MQFPNIDYQNYRISTKNVCKESIDITHRCIKHYLLHTYNTILKQFSDGHAFQKPEGVECYKQHAQMLCIAYSQVTDKDASFELYEELRNSHKTHVSGTIESIATRMEHKLEDFKELRWAIRILEGSSVHGSSYDKCNKYIKKLRGLKPNYTFDPVLKQRRSLNTKIEDIEKTHINDIEEAVSFIMAFFEMLRKCVAIFYGSKSKSKNKDDGDDGIDGVDVFKGFMREFLKDQ